MPLVLKYILWQAIGAERDQCRCIDMLFNETISMRNKGGVKSEDGVRREAYTFVTCCEARDCRVYMVFRVLSIQQSCFYIIMTSLSPI